MEKRFIYLDNAATTPMWKEAVEAMLPYFSEQFGNPSGQYSLANVGKRALENARKQIAATIGARPEEIYFTGSGTEADNWAIKMAARAYRDKGRHIITTKIEHHAVLHTCEALEQDGYRVTYLSPDEDGVISPESLERALTPATILVSIMAANNEIGTVEPIEKLARMVTKRGILFHTDAVQAYGKLPLSVENGEIAMLSASAHKIGGPKGVGFLYVRRDVRLQSFLHGGAQEKRRRAGTENVPGIVGLAKAAELTFAKMKETEARERELRDYFINRVLSEIPYVRVTGSMKERLSGHVSFCFQFIEGETVLIMLDSDGICASSGSACTTGQTEPSHVLTAIGLPEDVAHGAIRFTLGRETTKRDVDFTIDRMKEIIGRIRAMSPYYAKFIARENAEKEI
ncbi:MAG: cysteine desulfurase NifS [Lachnospiraceae bacterium]|nr:cysteine desulfurase NifS [Lachnospiraceae bacterium]